MGSSTITISGKERFQVLTVVSIITLMEAASTSEMPVNFYQTTWRNIPEDNCLHIWQVAASLTRD
jgi:hypothetical protein